MAKRMADDLRASGILTSTTNGQNVTFHITEMRNESSDVINRTIILNKLRTDLFRSLGGQVTVLDRSAEGLEAVRREREAKRAGAVSSNEGRRGDVLGSDYVLKGIIQDRVQQSGRMKSAYYLVTFELTDLETSLKSHIETHKKNFTRFLLLARKRNGVRGSNKASLCFEVTNQVGSLADALMIFKKNRINLSKIQSVPVIGKPSEYSIHIDVEWKDREDYENAMKKMLREVHNLSVLGEYKKAKIKF
jgi:hypothetical protein